MDLKGKKVLVFGAGKSGIGAADLLGSAGAQPVIYDGNADLDKKRFYIKQTEHTPRRSGPVLFRKERWKVLIS